MNKICSYGVWYFLCATGHLYALGKEAVCIVPVADLTGDGSLSGAQYHELPMNGPAAAVKRIDQLLFNERAFIVENKNDTVHIQVPTHNYSTPTEPALHHDYWTLSKNIAALDSLENTDAVPPSSTNQNVITLAQPFRDNKYGQLYSAGTRFVLDTLQDDDNYYRVLILSPRLKTGHIYIPKELVFETIPITSDQKVTRFLEILDEFAEQSPEHVPYVFGGNSFVKPYQDSTAPTESEAVLSGKYPNYTRVHSGFDCASLVFRAAQMAGIPLNYKNSSALKHHLKSLASDETIENGDIIFIPAHIMVVFDIDNNMIIEARTQTHGYGYVHKIALADLFKEIETIEQLAGYHHTKKPVSRLNSSGEVISRVPITVLKLKSVFENAPGRS